MIRPRLRSHALLAVSIAVAALVSELGAQRAVIFQHGLNSDGGTWEQAATRLARDYHIAPQRPSTNSFYTFDTQAAQLASQVASTPADALLIGHSNGGLLGRHANRPEVQNRPWGGILTVGTLHSGAPLATAVRNGTAARYGQYLAASIARPVLRYSGYYSGWREYWYWYVAAALAEPLYRFGVFFPNHVSSIGVDAIAPVVEQMGPSSGFINALNSPSNLSREAVALPYRIGITSSLDHSAGIMWKGLFPDSWRDLTRLQYAVGVSMLAAYEYYYFYDNYDDPYYYEKRYYAPLWALASTAVFRMDNDWCWLIGATGPTGRCAPSDGVVPTYSQVYPNGTNTFGVTGPAHSEETRSDLVEARLRESLDAIGVAPCSRIDQVLSSPASVSLYVGMTTQATASVVSVCGRAMAVPVSWASADNAIATVNGSGLITGVSAGATTISASAGGVSAIVPVTVTAGGAGGPSSISVSGPSTVAACTTARWTVSAAGGTPPLTYQWDVDGQIIDTGGAAYLDYVNLGGSSVNVRATVTDAQGYSKASGLFSTLIEGLCW